MNDASRPSHTPPPAEAQLDRFKSQELGMLTWAVARLGYMPAARLVRAALPHVAAARSPAVQVRLGAGVGGA